MKKLVIFSLLIISVLLIAGCQDTVGGFRKTSSSPSYSATDSTYTSTKFGSSSVQITLTRCPEGVYRADYIYMDYTCYQVKGCVDVTVLSSDLKVVSYQSDPVPTTRAFTRELPVLVYANTEIPCAQTSKGSVPSITNEEAMQDGAMILY